MFTPPLAFGHMMGVLLDIFIGVFLLGFFVNRISAAFDEAHSEALTQLKD